MDIHSDQLSLFDDDYPGGAVGVDLVPIELAAGADPARLARLDYAALACVTLRFGSPRRTLADTGVALGGLSRHQVRRLERAALASLAHAVPSRTQGTSR